MAFICFVLICGAEHNLPCLVILSHLQRRTGELLGMIETLYYSSVFPLALDKQVFRKC